MSTKNIRQIEELTLKFDSMVKEQGAAEDLMGTLATAFFPVIYDEVDGNNRREVEETTADKLLAAEARFRTLIEQIPAVTFMAVLGEGKNEIYVSPHVEALLGFTQEEWLADPFLWYAQLHVDDRQLWNEEFARGCRTGGPFRAECRFVARDGHIVWVHGEARVVKDAEGRPQFLQGVAFDITDAKRAQELMLSEAKAEEELAIARRVQMSVVPKTFDVEGLDIAAEMIPASEVGGDFYDVLPFKGGAWIAIGDVSGHGLNSGLMMLMLQSALSAITRAVPHATSRDVVLQLNEVMFDNIRTRMHYDDHVTFTLLKYQRDGRITFSGAHEDILICRHRTRKLEVIRPLGTWLGAKRDVSRVMIESQLHLEDGDLVVLYTDGITEAMDANKNMFDIDRLWDAIERHQDRTPTEIRDALVAEVRAFMTAQADDMSIVVLRYKSA